MDSNAIFAILLLIVGLGILSAEIFIPSGGLLGVITFFTLICSMLFAYRAWGNSYTSIFIIYCLLELILVPTVIGFGFYMLPRTTFGKRVLLEGPDLESLAPYVKESSRLERLVGRFGETVTLLNPGGLILLDGERLHALSEGLGIDRGTPVQIVAIRGTSVVVRPGTPTADSEETDSPTDSSIPFDFEIPPSA